MLKGSTAARGSPKGTMASLNVARTWRTFFTSPWGLNWDTCAGFWAKAVEVKKSSSNERKREGCMAGILSL
jgi:hypothetical protein